MGVGAAHVVQLALIRVHHHDTGGTGLGGDVAQRLVRLALQNVNFIDVFACPQGLDDGIASLDDAVGFGGHGIFSLFVHIVTPRSKIFIHIP